MKHSTVARITENGRK